MIALRPIFIAAAALFLAALAIGSGLDRMSGAGEVAPGRVPWPFRVNALRIEAMRLYDAGNYPASAATARLAAQADPANPSAVAVFAAASAGLGDRATQARAFGITRSMGWREPLTNLYWIRQALMEREVSGAADHLDALLRQTPGLAGREILFQQFEASGSGRDALAARLARNPAWATSYFAGADYSVASAPLGRAMVAERMAARYGARNCALIAPAIEAQLRFGYEASARVLYRLHCAETREGAAPTDGHFVRADPVRPLTALDWHFTGEGAVNIALEPRRGVGGRAVIIGNLASVPLVFASQRLAVPAGVHHLRWRAFDASGAPSPAVDAAVSCSAVEHSWLAKRLTEPRSGRFAADFEVTANCPEQWLSFGIGPGASNIALAEVAID